MKVADSQKDWLAKAREVLDIEARGLVAVRDHLGDSFVRALEIMAGCSGRVVVTGLGKSGLVGRKIAATLSSTPAAQSRAPADAARYRTPRLEKPRF